MVLAGRVLRHQTRWNRSLHIRPYAVLLRIERVLQLEHGLVTLQDPTDVLRRPVSQLLAELKPTFCCFFRDFRLLGTAVSFRLKSARRVQ